MKTIIAAVASLAMTTMALAADYYTVAAPLSAYSWAGPYLGGTIGYEWGAVSNSQTRPSGITGGFEGGYNWQNNQFVFGGETDINVSAADDSFSALQFSNPWYGTLRARAGVALGNVLLFGTAGLGYGELSSKVGGLSEDNTKLGFVVGGGAEAGLSPHWSAKLEYLYLDLTNANFSQTGTSNGLSANLLRFGLNYRF